MFVAFHALGMALQPARPPIRAIVTDIDGTLFPFGTSPTLSQRNADALNTALDAGVHVSLATGRIPGPWCERISGPVPRVGASVFSNGALVLDAHGAVLSERHLLPETVAAVVEHTRGGRAAGGGGKRRTMGDDAAVPGETVESGAKRRKTSDDTAVPAEAAHDLVRDDGDAARLGLGDVLAQQRRRPRHRGDRRAPLRLDEQHAEFVAVLVEVLVKLGELARGVVVVVVSRRSYFLVALISSFVFVVFLVSLERVFIVLVSFVVRIVV